MPKLETSANFVATRAGVSGAGFQREFPASVSCALRFVSRFVNSGTDSLFDRQFCGDRMAEC